MRTVQKEDCVVDENLDLLEMAVNFQREKTFRQRAQRRLAMKRLCQQDPVTSVCVDVVQKPLLLLALLFICWVLRVRSKNTKVKVIHCRSSAIRSLAQHCHDNKRAVSKGGPPSKDLVISRVMTYRLVVVRWRLLLSGDVEVNPGPLTQATTEIKEILATVDDTTFNKDDWNYVIQKCCSLSAEWKKLSGYLGLPQSDIDAIACDNAKVSDCWNEALSHWIKQNYNTEYFGEPSWRTLLKAIAQVDKCLFKHLANEHQVLSGAGDVKSGLAEKKLMGYNEDSKGKKRVMDEKIDVTKDQYTSKKLKLESESPPKDVQGEKKEKNIPAGKPHLSFPMLDKQNMTREEKEQLQQKLHLESNRIMYRFQKLFSATVTSLKERRVTATELSNHLGCLGSLKPTYKDSKRGYLRCELEEAKTVDDIMRLVFQYSSFFNYRMLQNVINNLGSEEDKRNLARYLEHFAEYAKRKVFESPCELGTMNEEGYANMFVTLDETYDNCTLISLKNFEIELKKILDIPPEIEIPLCRIEPGSIKLTIQIPHSEREHIFPLTDEQTIALMKLSVVQLSCGDYQFTKEEREDVGNSSSDEDSDSEDGQSMTTDTGAECYSMVSVAVREKGKSGSSLSDSGLGTYSRQSGPTLTIKSQFSDQDIFYRDLRDDPFLKMEREAAKLRPPDDSSRLELHQASRRGDLDEVKRLVEEKKLNPLEKDGGSNTALHLAAVGGHLDVTRYFIEEQSLVPACLGWHGRTPLHAAAEYNHFQVVDYLIAKQQVDPECQDDDGYTPLHRACMGGDTKVITYLVNEMSKLTPLKDVLYHRTKEGHIPLHLAAGCGHLKVVQLFISEYDVDPNTPGWRGRLPIHYAAQEGFFDIVKYLVEEQNTDPSCHDKDKVTPLYLAAANRRLDVVKYLTLDKHCNPLDRDSLSNTPLHLSSVRGHLNILDFFVSRLNCDPNTPGQWGSTPLHYAAEGGNLNISKYLIEEKCCNPSCLDERKTTPLHIASGKGHLHIVAYLIKEQNCKPLCYDKVLGTPLHWAAGFGQLNVVKYFVEDLNSSQSIRGPRNLTPLEEARAQGHTNVVKYLMSQ